MAKAVTRNENRNRVGEDHQRAKLTDAEVEAIRELHSAHRMPYVEIAEKFEVSYSTVEKICTYLRRAQVKVYDCTRTYRQKQRVK